MTFNGKLIFDTEQYLEKVCSDIDYYLSDEDKKQYAELVNKIDSVIDVLLDISEKMGYNPPVDDLYPY